MYCGDDGREGYQRGIGVGISGIGARGGRDMANEGVRVEVAGNYCGVCHR